MTTTKAPNPLGSLGNYQLLDEIGRGNFATVYRARHWESGRTVAVKVMASHLTKNAMLVQRFRQEGALTSKIDHPNVVRVLEYSWHQDQPFLVMELVEGPSLGERLDREGRIAEGELIRLMVQACQGLDQIHSLGLLHRDVKPDNLLVTAEGLLKIIDLGLGKDLEADGDMTRAGTGLGTPNFIAPEQFRNAKAADKRCDVYGLGATFYQLVTGVLPFASASPVEVLALKLKNQLVPPEELVPGLSTRTADAIRRALHNDPKQRLRSCWEFAEALVDTTVGLGEDFERQTAGKDFWYIKFRDRSGNPAKAAGTGAALGQALRQGRLGDRDSMRLARTMAGPFRAPEHYPELEGLLSAAADASPPVLPPATPAAAAGTDHPAPTAATPPAPETRSRTDLVLSEETRDVAPPALPPAIALLPASGAAAAARAVPGRAAGAPPAWLPTALFLAFTGASTVLACHFLFGWFK